MPVVTRQMSKRFNNLRQMVDHANNYKSVEGESELTYLTNKIQMLSSIYQEVPFAILFLAKNHSNKHESTLFAKNIWFKGFELLIDAENRTCLDESVIRNLEHDIIKSCSGLRFSQQGMTSDDLKRWSNLLKHNFTTNQNRTSEQMNRIVSLMYEHNYFKFDN